MAEGKVTRAGWATGYGKVIEIDGEGAKFNGTVPAGKVLVDGSGVGDIGNVVLRDRKHLSEDGLVVIVSSTNVFHSRHPGHCPIHFADSYPQF